MVMRNRFLIEIIVGIFILAGIVSLFVLAFKVSGWSGYAKDATIQIAATFDNTGDLKVRAPVKIAGVRIGEISDIQLDFNNYQAKVIMAIDKNSRFPNDSSASILSTSLLGSNYVAITPGFSKDLIKNGDELTETHPAMILENVIGAAIFTPKDKK
jgi:phospholipid/cholesterol/gamma-HCH transport system substrate-binding protein